MRKPVIPAVSYGPSRRERRPTAEPPAFFSFSTPTLITYNAPA